ncbi:DUF3363 domain-containing protein [Phenylobacterium sp.]|uniref:DUF3363 domain-containing protein n=1 Tax=Phenylobacterium sp. TaxID=1871053 RepID=UPI0025D9A636|nr:DUF3363 domain-containing protein [Phenylobacterium sp.]
MRLDLSQRVIVKALVSRHAMGASRGEALARHVAYLGRQGAGRDGVRATFFDRSTEGLDLAVTRAWKDDRHHFRLIVSPELGDRIPDLRGYVRQVMARVASDLGEPDLDWIATCHFDTDQPHAHVLLRGRRADASDLVISRQYISYGVRARAQEVAQEQLGNLARADAEQRLWRETQANRFTRLDRRLLDERLADGTVSDGVGRSGSWSALTRGRLRHLELLGLARKVGGRYRLADGLEMELRTAQLRMDVIRTMNQRRLETGLDVKAKFSGLLRGEVVKSGFHDELGGASYAIVREQGVEYYAALKLGQQPLEVGRHVALSLGSVRPLASSVEHGLGR